MVRVCGRSRGGGKEKEKEKEKEKDDQVVLTMKFPLCGARRIFSRKNENRKRTKAPQTPRKHIKRLLDFGSFYWLVWVFCIGL